MVDSIEPTQHFTKPPARYTEASLVKELEKRGLVVHPRMRYHLNHSRTWLCQGRKQTFIRRKMGDIVTDRLVNSFPHLMDYTFTAGLEENLDEVAEGQQNWKKCWMILWRF